MVESLNVLFKEAKKNYKIIEETYKVLEKSYDLKIPIHSAGQWVLDNMYIVEEQYMFIKKDTGTIRKKRLPMLKDNQGNKSIAIYHLACETVEKNTGFIDQNIILNSLLEHQKISYLSSEEIDLYLLMIRHALLKYIARLCTIIYNSQIKKMDVEDIIASQAIDTYARRINLQIKGSVNFKEYILDENNVKTANTAFIEYMAYKVKEMGDKGQAFYDLLVQEAEKNGFTVTEAIIKEHNEIAKTTEYIGRAISSFKKVAGVNFREIFERNLLCFFVTFCVIFPEIFLNRNL